MPASTASNISSYIRSSIREALAYISGWTELAFLEQRAQGQLV